MSTLSREGLTWCRQCMRRVRRTTTAAGHLQLVDPDPDESGNTVAYRDHTGTWRSRVPTADLPQAPHERRFMPHAATCPSTRRPAAPASVPQPAPLPANVTSLDAHRQRRNNPSTLF